MNEERLKEIERQYADAKQFKFDRAGVDLAVNTIPELLSEIRRLRDAERWIPKPNRARIIEAAVTEYIERHGRGERRAKDIH